MHEGNVEVFLTKYFTESITHFWFTAVIREVSLVLAVPKTTMLSSLVVYFLIVSARSNENCRWRDENNGHILDLRPLSNVTMSLNTTTGEILNMSYTPCRNGIVPHAEPDQNCEQNTMVGLKQPESWNPDDYCWFRTAHQDNGTTSPIYNLNGQNWTFKYTNVLQSSGITTQFIYWHCNASVDYYVNFATTNSEYVFQFDIDTKLACNQMTLT